LVEFYPVVAIAIVAILAHLIPRNKSVIIFKNDGTLFDLVTLPKPMFCVSMDFFFYTFSVSTIIFTLLLGPHTGAFMTYAYHLMIPPFLLWLSRLIKPHSRLLVFSTPLVLLNLILLTPKFLNPAFLSQRESREWAKLYQYAQSATLILNSPILASFMVERGMLPVDSGQTEYFYRFDLYPYSRNILLGPEYRVIKSEGREYKEVIQNSVINANYDMIIIWEGQWLLGYIYEDLPKIYTRIDSILIDMPQTGQVWPAEIWIPKMK
jgi:hypothetical protein